MKLIQDDKSVASNVQGAVQFGISSNSAKLFSMLSTALYTNKERAVLHELGANCSDEHVVANVDRPWDLTIPTSLDPYVKFRDYGRGLSEEQVYKLLTTYGESTKSDSNSVIGAYGIGSKSPAAVTSTWNVVSRFGGELKEYLVFIDRTGIPSITKLRTEKCTDTGLEVIIPVNPNRIRNWTEHLVEVFKHYTIKPNIINTTVKWAVDATPIQTGNGWKLFNTIHDSYYCNAKVITSHREYALDPNTIKTEFKGEDFLVLLPYHLEIEFPIGSLDMSLSREQLQYTHHTLDAIKAKLKEIYAELKSKIDVELSVATDGIHYRQLVRQAATNVLKNNPRVIMPFIKGNKYNVINEYDLNDYRLKVKNLQTMDIKVMYQDRVSTLRPSFSCSKTYAVGMDKDYQTSDGEIRLKIAFFDKLSIVIDDVRGTAARVKHAFPGKLVVILKKNIFPKEFNRFLVKASSLKQPPRVARAVRAAIKASAPAEMWQFWRNSFMKTSEKDLDQTRPMTYIEVDNVKSQVGIPENVMQLKNVFRKHSSINLVVIKRGKPVPKGFKKLEQHALDEIAKLNTPKFVEEHHYDTLHSQLKYSYNNAIRLLRSVDYRTTNPSVWNDTKDLLASITQRSTGKTSSSTYTYLCELAEVMKVQLVSSTGDVPTIDNIEKTLYNTYKMFKYVDSTSNKDDIIEYINLIGA